MSSQPAPTTFTPWKWPLTSKDHFPALALNEVHIWRSRLDAPPSILAQLQSYLSEDEQARAARFRFEHHRHHFIVGRGMLRVILGQYAQQQPQDLEFAYGDRGKPFLVNPDSRSQGSQKNSGSHSTILQFNVSHSGGVALYAIALHRQVGIDLEEIRSMPNASQLAQRFFTQKEHAQLLAQPLSQQEQAFFRGWTRKEAYLKATGEGLGGLESVEVSLLPHQPPKLQAIEQPSAETREGKNETHATKTIEWYIQDIPLDTNHMAAVVFEVKRMDGSQDSIRFFQVAIP